MAAKRADAPPSLRADVEDTNREFAGAPLHKRTKPMPGSIGTFPCSHDRCTASFPATKLGVDDMLRHMNEVHKDPYRVGCGNCAKTFATCRGVSTIAYGHTLDCGRVDTEAPPSFACTLCDHAPFQSGVHLYRHWKTAHAAPFPDFATLQCTKCVAGFEAASVGAMMRHGCYAGVEAAPYAPVTMHPAPSSLTGTPYPCDFCGMVVSRYYDHLQRKHPDWKQLKPSFACDKPGCTCGQVFEDAERLQRHKQVAAFCCAHCSKAFVTLRDMKKHAEGCAANPTRTDVSCAKCGKQFNSRNSLNQHVRRHHK